MQTANTGEITFRSALARLDSAQKPGGGVPAYTRWINRRLARLVAAAAASLGISADTVTLISGLISVLALVVLVMGPVTLWTGLVVAVLLALGYVFDSADGQVARLTGTSGPAGEWLDHVVDAVRTPGIHVAIVLAVAGQGLMGLSFVQYTALAFTLLTVGQFMSQVLAEQLARAHGSGELPTSGKRRQSLLLLPVDMGVICWIFCVWGAPALFSVVYSLTFVINLIYTGISMVRKRRKLALKT